MLDFHSEIPVQVVMSGVMGPLSRHAPLQLIAALAAAADGPTTAFDSSMLRSEIRAYVLRSRERDITFENIIAGLTGLVREIAPESDERGVEATLQKTVVWLATRYYYENSLRIGEKEVNRRVSQGDMIAATAPTHPSEHDLASAS